MNVKCPQCGKVAKWEQNKYRPFCSERCKLLDLGKWADEKFKVAVEPDENEINEIFFDEE